MTTGTRVKLLQTAARQQSLTVLSFVCGFLMLCVVGVIIRNRQDVDSSIRWVHHTYQVMQTLDSIRFDLYQSSLIRPSADDLDTHLSEFRTLTRDNPAQIRNFSILNLHLAQAKLDPSSTSARIFIQQTLTDMTAEESRLLTQRQLTLNDTRRTLDLGLYSALITAFLTILFILRKMKKSSDKRKTAEQKLHTSESKYRTLIDNVSAVIYSTNQEGRIEYANPGVFSLTGYSPEELHGKKYLFLVEPSFLPTVKKHYEKQFINNIPETTLQFRTITRIGNIKWVEQIALLLKKDGVPSGFQCMVRDITDKKQLELELEAYELKLKKSQLQYQEQLISAKTEADDARKMQEQFLANMSHEIRTPMNGIQGMTKLLLETPLTPQQEEFAAIINRSVDNLLVIINDILDFSKIKAGKLTIERIDFRLQDVITNVRSLFDHRTRKKGLRFDLDVDTIIPEWLQGDPHRLNQVLINLVGNAIKFTEKGSVSLRVAQEQRDAKEIKLIFTVTDTGIGIPQESIPHIFNSFSQAGMDISRKYGGTGLGLAICHQLLEMQGGSIDVTSTVGSGTSFSFRLSFGCQATTNISRQVAHSLKDFGSLLAGKKLLVVEDNQVNQKLMDYVLRRAGAAVTLANDGREAIKKLEVNSYDVIIMDLQMPHMDGYETTKYLRTQLQLRTPVMAMTANAISGEQLRCLEAGMNDYMSKPFDFKEFYTRVADLLHRSGSDLTQTQPEENESSMYNLSLLEEVGDDEYLQDILNTFLTRLPEQLDQLKDASLKKDHEKVFFHAHKMKGSCGMLQASSLTDKLSLIQKLARDKSDATQVVKEVAILFEALLHQLKKEIPI